MAAMKVFPQGQRQRHTVTTKTVYKGIKLHIKQEVLESIIHRILVLQA